MHRADDFSTPISKACVETLTDPPLRHLVERIAAGDLVANLRKEPNDNAIDSFLNWLAAFRLVPLRH